MGKKLITLLLFLSGILNTLSVHFNLVNLEGSLRQPSQFEKFVKAETGHSFRGVLPVLDCSSPVADPYVINSIFGTSFPSSPHGKINAAMHLFS
jgi:hypothetical protein